MAERGKAGMVSRIDVVTDLAESFAAAKATGTEPFQGTTGNKLQDKFIRDGQDLNLLRVVEGNNPPPYISEISKDKQAVERFRASHGLSPDPQTQAAASSSSGPVQHNIGTPRLDRSKSRERKGKTGETGGSNQPGRSSSVSATGASPDNVTLNKNGKPRKTRNDVGITRTKK